MTNGPADFITQYGLVPYKPWRLSRYSRDGACEACGITSAGLARYYSADGYVGAPVSVLLHFDHCHNHGWIRGRLCTRCNTELALAVRAGSLHKHRLQGPFLAHLRKCPDCLPHPAMPTGSGNDESGPPPGEG